MAARLTQIDYDREMALIALQGGGICAVVRLACDPNFETGEFAILVRTDLKGKGIGFALMSEILSYARSRGLRRMFGLVRPDNQAMLKMAKELGARPATAQTRDVVELDFDLAAHAG
jgi:acetyltransferase